MIGRWRYICIYIYRQSEKEKYKQIVRDTYMYIEKVS